MSCDHLGVRLLVLVLVIIEGRDALLQCSGLRRLSSLHMHGMTRHLGTLGLCFYASTAENDWRASGFHYAKNCTNA